jgi:N-acetylglucosamine kinase-like BadF-type ATPase
MTSHVIATLAVDIGGTGTRALLVEETGRETAHEFVRPEHAESALATLARIVVAVKDTSGLAEIRAIRAGLTGFNGWVPDIDELAEVLAERVGMADLVVADDSVPWALGALGGKPGVTVALGTGLVALGVGPDGRLAHVDGSGPYLGDRGSGWWVGRQGLIAAIAADENRAGGSARLLTAARDRFGPLRDLPEALRRDANPHATIATFAVDVVAAAEDGDEQGLRILSGVGSHVATAVAAAARRSGLPQHHDLALVGGLSNASPLFDASLRKGLAAEGFDPRRVAPLAGVLQGALLLDGVADQQPVVRRWTRREPTA